MKYHSDHLITDYLKDWFIQKSCLGCQHFILKEEICQIANQRPPAKVIVTGCQSHEETAPF